MPLSTPTPRPSPIASDAGVQPTHLAATPDGKFVVTAAVSSGSQPASVLARFNGDGTPDTRFGSHGVVPPVANLNPDILLVRSNESIVVGGLTSVDAGTYSLTDFALVTYQPNGAFDGPFGATNLHESVATPPMFFDTVAVQSDGKVLTGGNAFNGTTADIYITRYKRDGSIDRTFGTGGVTRFALGSPGSQLVGILAQANGKIIITAETFPAQPYSLATGVAVARLNANGSLDSTFGSGGQVLLHTGTLLGGPQVLPLAGERLLVGTSNGIFRLDANGSIDHTFHGSGDVGSGLFAQLPNGQLIAAGAGTESDLVIHRYNSDGTLDSSFGIKGAFVDTTPDDVSLSSMVILSDGDIVFAGGSLSSPGAIPGVLMFAVTGNGAGFDSAFGIRRHRRLGIRIAASLAVGPGGNVLVSESEVLLGDAGRHQAFTIKRFTPAGRLDNSFGNRGVDRVSLGDIDPQGQDRTPLAIAVDRTRARLVLAGTSSLPLLVAVDLSGVGGNITGTLFNDENGNGVRDIGEPPLSNWWVYIDYNNDGRFDGPDRRVFTDANGHYQLADLPHGTYHIRSNTLKHWQRTTAQSFNVIVTVGGTDTGVNFGNRQLA